MAGETSSPQSSLQAATEVETTEAMVPHLYDEGWVSLSKTNQSTQFGQGASLSGATVSFEAISKVILLATIGLILHFPLQTY